MGDEDDMSSLVIMDWRPGEFDWRRASNAIRRCTNLKRLTFDFNYSVAPVEGFELFCQGLAHNRSIEELSFTACSPANFEGESLELIRLFLRNNQNATTLRMFYSFPENFDVMSSIISSCTSMKKFEAAGCKLGSLENQSELFRLLGENQQLETLRWHDERDRLSSVAQIADLLSNQQSNLKCLCVGCQNAANAYFASIFQSLESNNKLLVLELGKCESFYHIDWDPLKRALRFYNHHLQSIVLGGFVESPAPLPMPIKSLLKMNGSEDKQILRIRKSLDYDFLMPEREFDGRLLENGFKRFHLPYLLASVGTKRSEHDTRSKIFQLSALYHFIKNRPLFIIHSRSEKVSNNSETSFDNTSGEKILVRGTLQVNK